MNKKIFKKKSYKKIQMNNSQMNKKFIKKRKKEIFLHLNKLKEQILSNIYILFHQIKIYKKSQFKCHFRPKIPWVGPG